MNRQTRTRDQKIRQTPGVIWALCLIFHFSFFMTHAEPCAAATGDKGAMLRDVRNGEVYRVERMADGKVWMAEDLRFGNCRMLSEAEYAEGSMRPVKGVMRSRIKGGDPLWGMCLYRATGGRGVFLYNWQAAMQDVRAAADTTWATALESAEWQGICPAGWHLPSLDEFRELWRTTGAELHRWLGIPADYVYANGQSSYGGYGGYWTSTAVNAREAFSLHFNHEYVDPAYAFEKGRGKAVRCVRNEGNSES